METKTIKPLKVFAFSFETTLKNMLSDAGSVPSEITQSATDNGFALAGPQIWFYHDCYGDMEKPFRLTIAQPVEGEGAVPGKFVLEQLPEISVVSKIHKEPWSKLGETYMKMMEEINTQGLRYSGNSREVYHHCDFENQENSVTEVQIEVR